MSWPTPVGSITQWNWDFDNDNIVDDITQNPSFNFPVAGIYPVSLEVTWPPCSADTIINVTVLPSPTSTFTVTSPLCPGDESTITYTGNAPVGANYVWDFDGGSIVSGAGQGPYQVSWNTPGIKDITLDVNIGSCNSGQTILNVVVNPYPSFILPPPPFVCFGESVNFNISGANTYTWDPPNGLDITVGPDVIASPIGSQLYTITGTTVDGCVGDTSILLTIIPFPIVTVDPIDVTICAGEIVDFVADGATDYSWEPATGLSSITGQNVSANPVDTTDYFVIGLENGCADTAFFTVNVNQSPSLIVGPDVEICVGDITELTASGANTYLWTPPTGLSSTILDIIDANPIITTLYTITGTSLGCFSTEDILVTVHPNPVLIIDPDATSFCAGDQDTIIVSGADTYSWGPSTGLDTNVGDTVIASPNTSQIYTVTGTSVEGCQSTINSTVIVYPNPIADFTSITEGCQTLCVNFDNLSSITSSGISSYLWDFGDGNMATQENPINCYPDTGTFDVDLIVVSDNGCVSSTYRSNWINVYPLPVAQFTIDPTHASILSPVFSFIDESSLADMWYWELGDGSTSIDQNLTHRYSNSEPGTYVTHLHVETINGCVDDFYSQIIIDPNVSIWIPNTITPNNNGLNEVFHVYGEGIVNLELFIYDRWGENLFRTSNMDNGWDARYKGLLVEQGVYIYKMIYTDIRGESGERIGNINVIY